MSSKLDFPNWHSSTISVIRPFQASNNVDHNGQQVRKLYYKNRFFCLFSKSSRLKRVQNVINFENF